VNTSAKPGCDHKEVKYLKAQEVFYCGDCGQTSAEDPRQKPVLTEVMPASKRRLLTESADRVAQ